MLMIPYVCADFHDKQGNPIFRITADMRRCMIEAPDAIKQDLLFDMLVADGSIKVPESAAQRKLLEQEPMLNMTADGKAVKQKDPEQETRAKTETKAESKTAAAETKK